MVLLKKRHRLMLCAIFFILSQFSYLSESCFSSVCDGLNTRNKNEEVVFNCDGSFVSSLYSENIQLTSYIDSNGNEVDANFTTPISLRDYLRGVVSQENGGVNLESAKAQALASLMFLVTKIGPNNSISGVPGDSQAFEDPDSQDINLSGIEKANVSNAVDFVLDNDLSLSYADNAVTGHFFGDDRNSLLSGYRTFRNKKSFLLKG